MDAESHAESATPMEKAEVVACLGSIALSLRCIAIEMQGLNRTLSAPGIVALIKEAAPLVAELNENGR